MALIPSFVQKKIDEMLAKEKGAIPQCCLDKFPGFSPFKYGQYVMSTSSHEMFWIVAIFVSEWKGQKYPSYHVMNENDGNVYVYYQVDHIMSYDDARKKGIAPHCESMFDDGVKYIYLSWKRYNKIADIVQDDVSLRRADGQPTKYNKYAKDDD